MKWEQMTMFQVLGGYLRIFGRNEFTGLTQRAMCAFLLALLLPVLACAYTVVLRSGRRIEIPAQFTVTPLTLTYETAPGINITLLMLSVDIAATERANGEPAGSLLKHADQPAIVNKVSAPPRAQRRELTQADIEAARRARQRSELEYERRRVELGLPSLAESRRRAEEETKRLREQSLQSEIEGKQSEAYWRERASELRTAIAALDAQINYIRERLGEMPDYPDLGSYTFITSPVPTFPRTYPVTRFPVAVGHPGFMHGINGTSAPQAGFLAFGGLTAQSQIQLNAGIPRGVRRQNFPRARGLAVPTATFFGVPSSNYDYSNDRAALISLLPGLEAERAGLEARWQELEDEARRAGAQPSWLRP
jgi:hypothetical protein